MKSDLPHQLAEFEKKIYTIRGKSVMLDSDLAEIYGVETKTLNRAVKRNVGRFPDDFIFQLTDVEFNALRYQIGTSKQGKGGRRYNPYVFTEHGAVMLASVLRSEIAVKASVNVVRAFVNMRSILSLHRQLAEKIDALEGTVGQHDKKFTVVSELLNELFDDPKSSNRKIGFIDD